MAEKAETLFKKKVMKDLKSVPFCWFTKVQQLAKRGDPDLICCVNGLFFGIELKGTEKDKATELQEYTINKIRDANGFAFVVHPNSWPKAFEMIRRLAVTKWDFRG